MGLTRSDCAVFCCRFYTKFCRTTAGGGGAAADHARNNGRECSLHAAHGPARQPSHQAWQAIPAPGIYHALL